MEREEVLFCDFCLSLVKSPRKGKWDMRGRELDKCRDRLKDRSMGGNGLLWPHSQRT